MKRIIDGKTYNTETADEIADYDNNLGHRDFRHLDEALYETKRGAFFLAGSGGALTKYAERCGTMSGEGKGIIPLSKAEALAWMEQHGSANKTEEYFGDIIEDA